MTSAVQNNGAVSNDLLATMNPSKTAASTTAEAQDRFMTLLVTQMKNQDPLNPLDNAQVTSQLAQLSTVTGIDKLNTTLQSLQGNYQASQSLQAASMIGRGVLAPGSSVALQDGTAVFGVDLAESADKLQVTIKNSSGNTVRTLDLGAQSPGPVPGAWDGRTDSGDTAPNGKYNFTVTAVRGGQNVGTTALAYGEVSSITTGAQGVKVNSPALGSINVADVRQIF